VLKPDASGVTDVYISKKDADELRNGETIRFMSLFNAKIKKDPTGVSADYVPRQDPRRQKGPVGIGVRGC